MNYLHSDKIKKLEIKANKIRESIIESLLQAGSGHTAGSLGMTDVLTLLYFHTLKHDPKNPNWEERDRLILSNGHICPALYATMAHAGYFPIKELQTLRKFGSRLQGVVTGRRDGACGQNRSWAFIKPVLLLSRGRWRITRGTKLGGDTDGWKRAIA
jgi:transketolase N-terminal domain/subunit